MMLEPLSEKGVALNISDSVGVTTPLSDVVESPTSLDEDFVDIDA